MKYEREIQPDGSEIIRIIPGREVVCDGACGEDYTDRPDSGGILFGSRAMCPKCAPRVEVSADHNGETIHIRARCPEGKSFADWVREDLR